MLFILEICILEGKRTKMRTVGGWVIVFCCFSFGAFGSQAGKAETLKKKITEHVARLLRTQPLPHSTWFAVQDLDVEEQVKGPVFHGKGTFRYSWSRITPSFDTLLVFTHQQSIAYQRTDVWESAQIKIASSLAQSVVRYARQWWTQNGGGSPALIDSVRIQWLPDLALEDSDTLYYPLRKLTWSDFRGVPRMMSRYGAEIFSNMGFDLEMEVNRHLLTIKLQGKCYMIRGISWVRPGNTHPYTLAHEQLHFDITQRSLLYWKRLVQELPRYWHPDDWSTAIQQAYLTAFRQMNRWQTSYDQETIHGQNEQKQVEWQSQFGLEHPY